MYTQSDIDTPLEVCPVTPATAPRSQAPGERIFIHTPHDGEVIPRGYLEDKDGVPRVDLEDLEHRFISARDWGANLVARRLSEKLGLASYARVRLARVLLDFNRFPGCTPPNVTAPLDQLAIGAPFDDALRHSEKIKLLEVYDAMSAAIEDLVDGAFLSIGVHTYDAHNPSATKRPDVSIISTPATYMRESRMPYGVFDPMYPDLLAESTCSRTLRDRMSLNLERSGFRVSHNQPYPLPEGSVEVRAQVWSFFRFVKARFEEAHPQHTGDESFNLVWAMLLNTNLRSHEGEELRGYLHRFRRPAPHDRAMFEAARAAYDEVKRFVNESTVVTDYRRHPQRPGALAIEVRKDLVCSFDENTGRPLPATSTQLETVDRIAEVIAGAIEIFLDTDRPAPRLRPEGVG